MKADKGNIPWVDVVIPTYAPEEGFLQLLEKLQNQTIVPAKIIIINTKNKQENLFFERNKLEKKYKNVEVYHIEKEEFDHGKTRNLGISYSNAPFFLCMTQDAVPADQFLIEHLLNAFEDPQVGVSYGRQLAYEDSHILEKFTREFNYPKESRKKTKEDIPSLGIKTFFCSNVCAMYRKSIYDKTGGFIQRAIFNEDMIYAADLIEAGFTVQYTAQAKVYHSHYYTGKQQFQRNFDLGVSQADHPEIFLKVKSEKEGKKLIKSTLNYLKKKKRYEIIPLFFYHSGCKYIGFKLGKSYQKLPLWFIKKCSMNSNYWT